MIEEIAAAYNDAIFDTDRDAALRIVHDALLRGVPPEDIVFKIVVPSIETMMKAASETQDVNLAQHFLASQIAAEVTDQMVALFKTPPQIAGRIVIGTLAMPLGIPEANIRAMLDAAFEFGTCEAQRAV